MRDFANKGNTIRINFVFGCLMLVCSLVAARLYYIQIMKGEHYRAWAQGLEAFMKEPPQERGEIFFRGGQPLAINKDFTFVYASPPKVRDAQNSAKILSGILKIGEPEILEKLQKDALYSSIKGKLDDAEVAGINEANLPGIYLETRKMRYYPQLAMASQLVGFVDDNYSGQYGLEEYYNDELAAGKDIVLNIDYNVQYEAERLISDATQKLNAQDGEIIVTDPKTGDVVAMAKSPNFDPNNYQEFAADEKKIKLFKNNSCQELFEPGSVFKAITMSSALNEGKVTPDMKYYDAGQVQIGGLTVYNYGMRSFGEQTMTNVLEHSINTGSVFVKNRLGNEKFADYIEKFGIFEPTGIDLPETYSQNLEFKKGYEINYATAAFGQGIEMTSIQLMRAYSALANGGWLVQPSVVRSEERRPLDAKKRRQVIDSNTATTISKMLESVIENGYSKKAKIPGYFIAGKTGTAQLSWSVYGIDRRGYSDMTMQSFIGYFPVSDPRFLVLVKLKAPEANTAEYSAMPVFRELARQIIYLYQIPPEEDTGEKTLGPDKVVPEIKTVPAAETGSQQPAEQSGQ